MIRAASLKAGDGTAMAEKGPPPSPQDHVFSTDPALKLATPRIAVHVPAAKGWTSPPHQPPQNVLMRDAASSMVAMEFV